MGLALAHARLCDGDDTLSVSEWSLSDNRAPAAPETLQDRPGVPSEARCLPAPVQLRPPGIYVRSDPLAAQDVYTSRPGGAVYSTARGATRFLGERRQIYSDPLNGEVSLDNVYQHPLVPALLAVSPAQSLHSVGTDASSGFLTDPEDWVYPNHGLP